MNFRTAIHATFLLLIALLVLAGCGGSSASTVGKVKPKATIEWPATTRGVQAPTYAGSAGISILFASSPVPSYWYVDRPSGSAAQTLTYEGPTLGAIGPAVLQVTFYSGPGATGTQVAVASASVVISADGTILNSAGGPLGTISYGTSISNLYLNLTKIAVGQTTSLTASANSFPNLLALPQSALTMAIVENPQNATITDNLLTGIAEGPIKVRVGFENLSFDFQILVTPADAASTRRIFPAKHIAWDPVHNRIWGTFAADSLYANSIVDINPSNGAIGVPISVGSDPNRIVVSSDGLTAYVGLDGATAVRKVNLSTRTAGATTNLLFDGDSAYAISLSINPSDSNEFAVCLQNVGNSGYGGSIVYRNGVKVGTDAGLYTAATATYVSGTSIIGGSNNSLYAISVSPTSVDFVQTFDTGVYVRGDLFANGSILALNNGYCFDSATVQQLGRFTYGQEEFTVSTIDAANNMGWGISESSQFSPSNPNIRAFNLTTFAPIAAVNQTMDYQNGEYTIETVRFGTTGLAILSTKALYILPTAPGL